MAVQMSTALRNAILDAIEATIGTTPVLKIRTGTQPADCATADSGTVLAALTLPSDWLAAAASGAKAMSGTWSDSAADNSGTAGHWRLYASDGATCYMQGSVSVAGGGGEMILSSLAYAAGQSFSVTTFTLTAGNA